MNEGARNGCLSIKDFLEIPKKLNESLNSWNYNELVIFKNETNLSHYHKNISNNHFLNQMTNSIHR